MTEKNGAGRWIVVALLLGGFAAGLFFALGLVFDATKPGDGVGDAGKPTAGQTSSKSPSGPAIDLGESQEPPPPHYRFNEKGRLSIETDTLPNTEIVAFGLSVPDDSRGKDPLPAIIVSVDDGRRLESTATPVAGKEAGVRLEIATEWLEPGSYMIQIRTTQDAPLRLQRYVLEVK